MGVVRPPWVSKEWFKKCPFNYCDHFGDKEVLAKFCKICKEEIVRIKKYEKEGKDPYDWKNVLNEVSDSLMQAMVMLDKEAERLGIDLTNIEDEVVEEPPPPDTYPIYKLVRAYGDRIEKLINSFSVVPIEVDVQLLENALDIFSHSRHFIIAKSARAFASRWREERDPILDENPDSKTSAFFAYLAIVRNSKALLALAKHKPLDAQRAKFIKLTHISLEVSDMIREEFFPDEELVYEEFGCDEI